jgi:hypothetical protein
VDGFELPRKHGNPLDASTELEESLDSPLQIPVVSAPSLLPSTMGRSYSSRRLTSVLPPQRFVLASEAPMTPGKGTIRLRKFPAAPLVCSREVFGGSPIATPSENDHRISLT